MKKTILLALALLLACFIPFMTPGFAADRPLTPEEAIAATDALQPMQIRAAADAGEPAAQYLLGRNALFGPVEARDPEAAWFWLHSAADMDFPPAQFLMSYMCQTGIFMAKDVDSAKNWLDLAAKNGNKMAQKVVAGQSYEKVLEDWLPLTSSTGTPERP